MKITNIIKPLNINFKSFAQKPFFKGGFDSFEINNKDNNFRTNYRNELNSRKDEIYSYIDSLEIENENNTKSKVEDILKSYFKESKEDAEVTNLIHKTMAQNAEKILKEGFSTDKIANTKYGPGIYFGTNEGSLEIYSGVKIKASYKGNIAQTTEKIREYEDLSGQIASKLMDYLGNNIGFSNESILKYYVVKDFVNEYLRETIVNKLKIDGAMTNYDGYFVAFNPKNIEIEGIDTK